MVAKIIVAVIGAVAVIVAALIQRGKGKRGDALPESAGIVIGEPRDGAVLEVPTSAPRPNRLPVSGRVVGVGPDALRRGDLQVEIVIRTDAAYPQGKVSVAANGHWLLPDARFGGDRHDITAILIDSAGKELATAHNHAFIRRV